ncbi:hypothetical protein HH1059_01290 [Halorhodospira halochloris]|uniref:Uncharacterized protein n=1 Tax=Halorhodospira halochloris TaxID=1052 RepID=A0A2Z6EZ89_HALHR|nr:hypothetical protein HH1059_01290 [Halorhodospira halochloris]
MSQPAPRQLKFHCQTALQKGTSKNFAGATIRPGVEDAVNPSLEASWRHPWRQDLHTGADGGAGEVFRGHQKVDAKCCC